MGIEHEIKPSYNTLLKESAFVPWVPHWTTTSTTTPPTTTTTTTGPTTTAPTTIQNYFRFEDMNAFEAGFPNSTATAIIAITSRYYAVGFCSPRRGKRWNTVSVTGLFERKARVNKMCITFSYNSEDFANGRACHTSLDTMFKTCVELSLASHCIRRMRAALTIHTCRYAHADAPQNTFTQGTRHTLGLWHRPDCSRKFLRPRHRRDNHDIYYRLIFLIDTHVSGTKKVPTKGMHYRLFEHFLLEIKF